MFLETQINNRELRWSSSGRRFTVSCFGYVSGNGGLSNPCGALLEDETCLKILPEAVREKCVRRVCLRGERYEIPPLFRQMRALRLCSFFCFSSFFGVLPCLAAFLPTAFDRVIGVPRRCVYVCVCVCVCVFFWSRGVSSGSLV
jgi:hypothetical protein